MRGLAALLALLWVIAGPAAAQDAASWDAVAERAEAVISEPGATETQLTSLRDVLSDQRSAALEEQDRFRDRLATLNAQLEALGPEPAEGETESVEIAARRADLNERIKTTRDPVIAAEAAYQRADGLINEIDAILRARLFEELLRRGDSPLLPSSWLVALEGARSVAAQTRTTLVSAFSDADRRAPILSNLPILILACLFAIALIFYVRPRAIRGLSDRYDQVIAPGSRAAVGFLITLTRLALPLIAALAVTQALQQISPGGRLFDALTAALPYAAATLVAALWLSNTVFSRDGADMAVLQRRPKLARSGQRAVMTLGILQALLVVIDTVYPALPGLRPAGYGVIILPLLIVGTYAMIRLCRAIKGEGQPSPALTLLTRFCILLAIAAPIAVMLGYVNLGVFFFTPLVLSLAVIGAFATIFALFHDGLDRWLEASGDETKKKDRSKFRLLPVLIGLLLVTIAVPIIVLIWGARTTDLEEVWIFLRDGVAVGESRVSVADFVTFVVIFVVGYTLTRLLQAVVRNSVLPRTDIDVGGRNAIVTGLGYVGIFLAAAFAVRSTGLNFSNIAIVAGALSVGIGFGLQTIVSNFVSGIILLIERPIKEGDWIEVAGFAGYVRQISVRSTWIETFDRASVIVPNQELVAGSVLNWTHENAMGRVIVPVGVGYDSDVREVERILGDIAESHPMVLRTPAPGVFFMGFGADSLDFEIRAVLRDVNYMLSVKSEMNYSIIERFREAGIEIPFRQTDVSVRNIDALRDALAAMQGGADDKGPVS